MPRGLRYAFRDRCGSLLFDSEAKPGWYRFRCLRAFRACSGHLRHRRWPESDLGGKEDRLALARILRGAPVAKRIRAEVQSAAAALAGDTGIRPALATVMVGHAPPSAAYREAIGRAMGGCGITHTDVALPVASTTGMVVETIQRLNEQEEVHGILVLLPLPAHIHALEVISAIEPRKDVDGISPTSVGRLHLGLPTLHPSTPLAGLEILDYYQIPVAGKRAVVVGRGNVVGKPMAALLTVRDATVTLCHTRTAHLPEVTAEAELVVMAAGHAGLLDGSMIRRGATVIDFGVNVSGGRVYGDADSESVAQVAAAYTPVPGGTTPVTTMALARNTVTAAFAQSRQRLPAVGVSGQGREN